MKKIVGIEYAKIAAAWMIVLFHIAALLPFPCSGFGVIGVSIFVQASGFCVACNALRGKKENISPINYTLMKLKRFYPYHIVCFLLVAALRIYMHMPIDIRAAIVNLLLLQSWVPDATYYFSYNGVSWYLSVLVLFWLATPFLKQLVQSYGKKKKVWFFSYGGAFVALAVINIFAAKTVLAKWILYIFPLTRLIEYAMGVCAGALYAQAQKKIPLFIRIIWICLYAVTVLAYRFLPMNYTYCFLYIVPTTCLLLAAAQLTEKELPRFLQLCSQHLMDVFLLHQMVFQYLKYLLLDRYNIPNAVAVVLYFGILGLTIAAFQEARITLKKENKKESYIKNDLNHGNRFSSLEFLRLFAMFLIVLSHFYIHGGFQFPNVTLNKIMLQAISFGGKWGVDCFVIITGYFSCKKIFKAQKVIALWIKVVIYALLCMAIAGILKLHIGVTGILQTIMPISMESYWFITTYLILLLISPFLNVLLKHLSETMHGHFISILFAIVCVFPIVWLWENKRMASTAIESIGLFVLLYCLGAMMKRTDIARSRKSIFFLGASVAFYGCSVLFEVVCNLLGKTMPLVAERATFYGAGNSPFLLLSAACAVCFCLNKNNWYLPVVNIMATAVLDVYLLSENILLRDWIWQDLLKAGTFENSPWLIPVALGETLLVFTGCLAIGLIFQKVLFQPLLSVLQGKLQPFYRKADVYFNSETL